MATALAKADKTRQISIEQENAIDLLIQGKPDAEVGEAVGVSRQTVCDWRHNNPAFIAELNKRREAVWGASTDRLRGMVNAALDTLEDSLTPGDSRRLEAAVHVLKCVGLYGASLKPNGPTSEKKADMDIFFNGL